MSQDNIKIREADPSDAGIVSPLIAGFRVYLRSLHGISAEMDTSQAKEEFDEYISNSFPVYIASSGDEAVGYMVLRPSGGAVWAESLYVTPGFRRRGIASMLFSIAEKYADDTGSDCVFNWVHPNNDMIIGFLKSKGYSTLNLIEIRKDTPDGSRQKITVGSHKYNY